MQQTTIIQGESLEYRELNARHLSHYVVPIFTLAPHSRCNLISIGSGVIVGKKDRTFLITTLHMLRDLKKHDSPAIFKMAGKTIKLEKLVFHPSEEYDLAVTELFDFWLKDQGVVGKFPRYDVDHKIEDKHGTEEIYVIGYPYTKNILSKALKKQDITVLTLTVKLATNNHTSSQVVSPLILEFNTDKVISTNKSPCVPPKLVGMSGGGIFQLFEKYILTTSGRNSVEADFKLIGIGLEHKLKENVIIGATIESLNSVLDETIRINDLAINDIINKQGARTAPDIGHRY